MKESIPRRWGAVTRAWQYLAMAGLMATLLGASGCAVGPEFQKPTPEVPAHWGDRHGGDAALALPESTSGPEPRAGPGLPPDVWTVFKDPELTSLIERARSANPDLKIAMLHWAEARIQESTVTAQRGIQVNAAVDAARRRDSEYGADTRLVDIIGGANPAPILQALGKPYSLYRPGFDASWEPDVWGRQRRSEESARAGTQEQAASLHLVRLTVLADVGRNYFELRSNQRQELLLQAEISMAGDEVRLLSAQQAGGLIDDSAVLRERQQVNDLLALAPQLATQEARAINQLTQLLGARPGDLNAELAPQGTDHSESVLPDLAAGLPSEFVRRRPDIAAAEARLHGATANVGVAVAELYPSITLGASFGLESVGTAKLANWGARDWSVGPSLDIPVFDHGRRKATVTLRSLQQQEAAVAYQQTVLKAWHEVDDAISSYRADDRQCADLAQKVARSQEEAALARARADAGSTSVLPNLEAQSANSRARRSQAGCESQRSIALVALYKALGG